MTACNDAEQAGHNERGLVADHSQGTNLVAMRPERTGRCSHGNHALLRFRQDDGPSELHLGIDDGEARLLTGERRGVRTRQARTYETLEGIIAGLGATVVALHLVGSRRRGVSGEIELAHDGRSAWVRAHPGDVAILAWRLHLPVLVPVALTTCDPIEPPRGELSGAPGASALDDDAMVTFGPFLNEPAAEDYDW